MKITTTMRKRSALAFIAAGALVAGFFVPVAAAAAQGPEVPLTKVSNHLEVDSTARVPLVDTGAGVGERPGPDRTVVIPLRDQVDAAAGAVLLRVSVFAASQDTLLSVQGAPALAVREGSSASNVIVVDAAAGEVVVDADADVDVRIEVVATLASDVHTPGSTVPLSEAFVRADTRSGLAGDILSSAETPVGLVGAGGVPREGVRAVYASVLVEAASPSLLTLGSQEIHVGQGATVLSALLPVDARGGVLASIEGTDAHFRLDVRGWIPESLQGAAAANVPGSMVPRGLEPINLRVAADSPTEIAVDGVEDASYILAMVTGSAPERTTVADFGADEGRAKGVLLDAAHGAAPQLALIPVIDGTLRAAVREGESALGIAPIAVVIADEVAVSATPELIITSPIEGERIDLADETMVKLTGTIESDIAIAEVTVSVNGQLVSTAALSHTLLGVEWSYEGGVPSSGEYLFDVRAMTLGGGTASESVRVRVDIPDADAQIVADDVINIDASSTRVSEITDDTVVLTNLPADLIPGSVIVAGVSDGAPQGFLRRVESVDGAIGGGWVVRTSPAAFTDVFWQIDEVLETDLLSAGDPIIEDIPSDDPDVIVVDDGVPDTTVGVDDADGSDVGGAAAATGPFFRSALAREPAAVTAAANTESSWSLKLSTELNWEPGNRVTDTSKASESSKAAAKASAAAKAGINLKAHGSVGMTLTFKLKVSVEWGWVPKPVLERFELVTGSNLDVTAALEAYLKVETTYSTNRKISTVSLPPVNLTLVGVPIVITSKITTSFDVGFSIETSVATEFGFERKQRQGFSYTDSGGMQRIDSDDSSVKTPVFGKNGVASVKGKIEAAFGPRLTSDVSIWDAAGPRFTIAVKGGVEATATLSEGTPEIALNFFVEGRASGALLLKVPLIDHVLLEWTFAEITARVDILSVTWTGEDAFPDQGAPNPGMPTDPEQPAELPAFTAIEAGPTYTLAIAEDQTLWAWGANESGQLGTGDLEPRLHPTRIEGLTGVIDVSAAHQSVFAVKEDGSVWAWGFNLDDQLGFRTVNVDDGPGTFRITMPTRVPSLSDVIQFVDGRYAVTIDGDLYTHRSDNVAGFVPVDGLPKIVAARMPEGSPVNEPMLLTRDGRLLTSSFTTGRTEGVIADRWVELPALPVALDAIDWFDDFLFAHRDGRWLRGQYAGGFRGRDGVTYGVRPGTNDWVPVQGLPGPALQLVETHTFTPEYESYYANFVLTDSGVVWARGNNDRAQLGFESEDPEVLDFAAVPGLTGVVSIAAPRSHAGDTDANRVFALTADGVIFGWGDNRNGELGDGTTERRSAPVMAALPVVGAPV